MQIQITGQGLEVTPALRNLTEKKLRRIRRLLNEDTYVHLTFHTDKLRQLIEANIKFPGGSIHAQAESDDMYKTIDLLIHKIKAQLNKQSAKKGEHI